jgi:mannitol/fructose-specific phosphotransferase system IIA component (Ntr-type)
VKVSAHLPPDRIYLDAALPDKDAVLRFVAAAFVKNTAARDPEKVYQVLKQREALMSTGIGGGIGIPHALTDELDDLVFVLIRLKAGIPFEAFDHRPVDIVVGLGVPENETSMHLRALAGISGLLKKPGMQKTIRSVGDPLALWNQIRLAEEDS